MFTRFLGALLVCLGLASAELTAQYASGDIIVTDLTSPTVWGVDRAGSLHTVCTGLGFTAWSVMCAPDNRTMWISGTDVATGKGQTIQVAPDGSVTSLFSIGCYGMGVDGAGDVIGAGKTDVFRIRAGQLQVIHSGNPFAWIRGAAIDLASGSFVVHDKAVDYYRFDYYPKYALQVDASRLVRIPPPVTGVASEPSTGQLICTCDRQVVRVNLVTHTVSTLFDLSTSQGPDGFGALARDPHDGTFVAPATRQRVGQPAAVLRVDPRNRVLTTIAHFPSGRKCDLLGIAIANSRYLAGMNEARPGQAYRMRVSIPQDAFAAYVVALSFGYRPGIKLSPSRTLHLNPDALFSWSLTNAGIFSGLQGLLDHQGEAVATVKVPNLLGLRGLRLFAAALTISRGKVRTMSAPIGFTIR